jgi:hypothetical protein
LTYLVEIFLPLADKAGETFPRERLSEVMEELKRKFAGITVYDRSPAKGKTVISSDDIVIFEVMTDDLERDWWSPCRARLEAKFRKTKSLSALPASKGYSRRQVSWGAIRLLWRQIMSVKTAFALMLALASTAAAAETVTEKTGVNSALGIAPKTQDFVTQAAVSDMTEIAAANIALQKGDWDEKQFADQMVKDHTQTSTELKDLFPSATFRPLCLWHPTAHLRNRSIVAREESADALFSWA